MSVMFMREFCRNRSVCGCVYLPVDIDVLNERKALIMRNLTSVGLCSAPNCKEIMATSKRTQQLHSF